MKQHGETIWKSFHLIGEVDKWYPWLLLIRNLLSALLPLYLSGCISLLVTELAGAKRSGYLVGTLAFLAFGAAIGKLAGAALEWSCSARYMKIQDAFTAKSSRKAMRMEFTATEDTEIQDLYVHAWQANLAAGTILEQVFSLLGYGIQMAGCIGILFGLDPLLLAVLIGFLILFDWLEYRRSVWEGAYAREVVPALRAAEYTRQCMGELSYAKDVRLFYPESFLTGRLRQFQEERLGLERKKEGRCARLQSLQAALQMVQTAALYLVLAYRFLQGKVPIGYVSLAVSSVTIFSQAVQGISAAWNQVLKHEVFLGYLERFWELPEPETASSKGNKAVESAGNRAEAAEKRRTIGRIEIAEKRKPTGRAEIAEQKNFPGRTKADTLETLEFRHVWFRYPGSERYALQDINVVLKRKEIVTLVGENGSGKTTFVKLLLRLYRPTKGEILCNGIPAWQYTDEEYQRLFAPVFQDYQLFAYSLRENLSLGHPVDEEQIQQSLEELGLWEKLQRLPKGWDHCIGKGYEADGIELSGGERQKLAIARAIGKGSACLVLDEPTTALDPISEVKLYQSIQRMCTRRNSFDQTSIFITHRLAGIRFSQQIFYFQDGRIAEQGSYEELMEEGRQFREFYELQARLYEGMEEKQEEGKDRRE